MHIGVWYCVLYNIYTNHKVKNKSPIIHQNTDALCKRTFEMMCATARAHNSLWLTLNRTSNLAPDGAKIVSDASIATPIARPAQSDRVRHFVAHTLNPKDTRPAYTDTARQTQKFVPPALRHESQYPNSVSLPRVARRRRAPNRCSHLSHLHTAHVNNISQYMPAHTRAPHVGMCARSRPDPCCSIRLAGHDFMFIAIKRPGVCVDRAVCVFVWPVRATCVLYECLRSIRPNKIKQKIYACAILY